MPETEEMKAAVCSSYGPPDVLTIKEVSKPDPKDNEIRIRIKASTVTAGDCEMRRFEIAPLFWLFLRIYMGIKRPRIPLGQEISGEVEAVGKKVTRFHVGETVFAATLMRLGGHAEFICLPETFPILTVPANMTLEEAATIPTGGINGLHFLRMADVKAGDEVAINGAGGSIGTYALQIAKAWDANVTCVDRDDKLEMLLSMGADHVIDYAKEDFLKSKNKFDVIIDVVGKCPYAKSLRALKPHGRLVLGNPTFMNMIKGVWTSRSTDKKVYSQFAGYKREDLQYLKELIESGAVRSVIDRMYQLDEISEAHRYVESGMKKGNLVVRIS